MADFTTNCPFEPPMNTLVIPYLWASIARYLPPPPTPWLWVCIVAPQYPPLCGVGGGGWWCTPLPPVVWVVWVVVGGGGGGRSCICMYMNVSVPPSPLWCGWCGWWWWKKLYMYVYECIWWYECIFLVFAYDYDMIFVYDSVSVSVYAYVYLYEYVCVYVTT